MEYSVLGFGHCIGSSDAIMQFFPGKVVLRETSKTLRKLICSFTLAFNFFAPIDINQKALVAFAACSYYRICDVGRCLHYLDINPGMLTWIKLSFRINIVNILFLLKVCFQRHLSIAVTIVVDNTYSKQVGCQCYCTVALAGG